MDKIQAIEGIKKLIKEEGILIYPDNKGLLRVKFTNNVINLLSNNLLKIEYRCCDEDVDDYLPLTKINHPNIAKYYDIIKHDKFILFFMYAYDRFDDGKRILKYDCIKINEAIKVISQIIEITKYSYDNEIYLQTFDEDTFQYLSYYECVNEFVLKDGINYRNDTPMRKLTTRIYIPQIHNLYFYDKDTKIILLSLKEFIFKIVSNIDLTYTDDENDLMDKILSMMTNLNNLFSE